VLAPVRGAAGSAEDVPALHISALPLLPTAAYRLTLVGDESA
jgi:hypothetical protein